MEIEFTRTVHTFYSLTVEADAITALLDEHQVGETGESVSDRLWDANSYSAQYEAFWSALADQAGTQTVDTDTDFTLDEEDADDEEDDDDEDDDSDNEDENDTSDLSALLIDA